MNKNKHMNLNARILIESELLQGSSFKSIGTLLGKDCTTISKEIRGHLSFTNTGAYGRSFNDCTQAFHHLCTRKHICERCTSRNKRPCWACGKCIESCPSYESYPCPKLKKPPYVCNACSERTHCSLKKSFYKAALAHKQYERLKSESRSGVSLSEGERQYLDRLISPLLKKGQSLHHIATNHSDETMKSERTLYTYVNSGLFSARNMDMPRTVRMRPRKTKNTRFKVDKSCRIGRSYEQYLDFCKQHPDIPVRQIDSVEGLKGGAVLLTIHFVQQHLQLAFLRTSNDSQSVIDLFNRLYFELNPEIFLDIFPVLLADNGSEFSNPSAIEYDRQGNQRTRIFYCDPNAPYQKPNCENNHEMIRRCIPKGVDFGQYTQKQISLMMSHINSYSRPNLGNKSPYDVFAFQYGKAILHTFGLQRIPPDEIILTPKIFTS